LFFARKFCGLTLKEGITQQCAEFWMMMQSTQTRKNFALIAGLFIFKHILYFYLTRSIETRNASVSHANSRHCLLTPGEYSGIRKSKKNPKPEVNLSTEEKVYSLALQANCMMKENNCIKLIVFRADINHNVRRNDFNYQTNPTFDPSQSQFGRKTMVMGQANLVTSQNEFATRAPIGTAQANPVSRTEFTPNIFSDQHNMSSSLLGVKENHTFQNISERTFENPLIQNEQNIILERG